MVERGGTDRLRLQRVNDALVSIPAMKLHGDDARELLAFVQEDRT